MNIFACYEVNSHSLAIEAGAINNFCLFSKWDKVKVWFEKAIAQGIHYGFVIEEERLNNLDAITSTPAEIRLTLFKGHQGNWDESYEITVEIKTLDSANEREI